MISLLHFILKNGAVFLFLFLQTICMWMIITFNDHQREVFIHHSVMMTAGMQEKINEFYDYWALYRISDSLAEENARLLKLTLTKNYSQHSSDEKFKSSPADSIIAAKIIYNSVSGRNNYLLINKGSRHSLDKGMGVIDQKQGIIGITTGCTHNYCKLISLLHSQTMISAKIKDREYFGSLVWRSANPRQLQMEAVPVHARFEIGDTIITSGYSTLFPEGIPVGVITDFHIPTGSNFYRIDVRTLNDLSKAKYIYVIKDLHRAEKDSLLVPLLNE